jgi:hypothetical protein
MFGGAAFWLCVLYIGASKKRFGLLLPTNKSFCMNLFQAVATHQIIAILIISIRHLLLLTVSSFRIME